MVILVLRLVEASGVISIYSKTTHATSYIDLDSGLSVVYHSDTGNIT